MDQNSAVIDEKLKSEMKKKLVDRLIFGLREKKLTIPQMKSSAQFILDKIDKLNDLSSLILFLDELKTKWPVYDTVYTSYKYLLNQKKEEELIKKLTTYIKSSPQI